MHMAIQPVVLLNFPLGGVFDRAALAVVVAILAIAGRVDFREQISVGSFDRLSLIRRKSFLAKVVEP